MYFWNAGLGLVMMLVISAAALWKRELLRELAQMLPPLPVAAAVIGFCLCTCAIAAPSVSLEGRCFWILREAPVGEKMILWIKTGFQLLLTRPCTLVAVVCLSIALAFPVWQGVVLFVAMGLFAVAHACFAMLMGLAFPKLDAANETVVVKQSLSVLLSMFVPMAGLAVAGVLSWIGGRVGAAGAVVAPTLFFAAAAAVCAGVLCKKGPAMIGRL